MCLNLELKDSISLIGVLGSLTLIFIAVLQYMKAERQKRAEHFFKLREKYNTDEAFIKIREIIDRNEDGSEIQLDEKRKFLGFYEEIAIMVNSKLLSEELAFYMFGYYAIKCIDMGTFITYINEDKEYWEVFTRFAKKMKHYHDNIKLFNYESVVIKN